MKLETRRENREPKNGAPRGKEPARLVALSDGLFATVLTLLVLDLRIPDALSANGGDWNTFVKWIAPHLFSYLLTFLVAANYWLAHHRDFDHIVHYDRTLLGYNLLFLLFVGLLPFSTALISLESFRSNTYPTYWAIYAVNIILAGILLTVTWNFAASHRLVSPETTPAQVRNISVRQMAIPAVFLVSIITEYLFPQALLGPYTLLAIPIVLALMDRTAPREGPATESSKPGWSEVLWRSGPLLLWLLIIGLAAWVLGA